MTNNYWIVVTRTGYVRLNVEGEDISVTILDISDHERATKFRTKAAAKAIAVDCDEGWVVGLID